MTPEAGSVSEPADPPSSTAEAPEKTTRTGSADSTCPETSRLIRSTPTRAFGLGVTRRTDSPRITA